MSERENGQRDREERYKELRREYRTLLAREAQYRQHMADLIERVKELNCLYTISDLTNRTTSLEDILRGAVTVMPSAMQYPEISCVRITLDEHEYSSESCPDSEPVYSAPIPVPPGEAPGLIEMFYRRSGPETSPVLLLAEEKKLVDEIAVQLGNVMARLVSGRRLEEARRELEQKARSLEEMNTALTVLLNHQESERTRLEQGILANLRVLVFPYLEKMRPIASPEELPYLDILERNLEELTKPFAGRLSELARSLTPAEIQVARMIIDHRTTKEIAEVLHLSESTVGFHRKNIRRKLGLSGRKANLASSLQILLQ